VLGLLSLPSAAASHWVERYYGQSIQGWGSWFWDTVKGGAVALVLAIVLALVGKGLLKVGAPPKTMTTLKEDAEWAKHLLKRNGK